MEYKIKNPVGVPGLLNVKQYMLSFFTNINSKGRQHITNVRYILGRKTGKIKIIYLLR